LAVSKKSSIKEGETHKNKEDHDFYFSGQVGGFENNV
jgi:hypothetical protein